jgi:hypothetical protein
MVLVHLHIGEMSNRSLCATLSGATCLLFLALSSRVSFTHSFGTFLHLSIIKH